MEYTFKSRIHKEKNSNPLIRRVVSFTLILTLLLAFSIWQKGLKKEQQTKLTPPVEQIEQAGDNEMSAVKFTALPFILAFKHFIVENEK
jgi:hypothetical protein